jgi:CheY-like chemotaxis protein
VLIVDDDPDDIQISREALIVIDPSILCLTAKDGEDAWEVLKNEPSLPDYIFADINMPVMDGKEFLIHIKNSTRFKTIPVIIFSTSTNDKEIVELKKLGAKEFIVKPHSFDKLVQSIKLVIHNKVKNRKTTS